MFAEQANGNYRGMLNVKTQCNSGTNGVMQGLNWLSNVGDKNIYLEFVNIIQHLPP